MRRVVVPLAVASVLLGACGSESRRTATHADFVRAANGICAEKRAEVRAKGPVGVGRFGVERVGDVIPILREERDDVAALPTPGRGAHDVELLIARWDDVLAALDRVRDGAAGGDDAAIVFGFKAAARANTAAGAIARRLGLTACRPFSPIGR